ncbi:Os02g0269400 [Oryza sativa Japonica Group]|uniref:Os02g0269400 protein n=1 Tax=Oryza sativa subsp. japonica TaxID=39947 RepID=A0A0P0VHF2_ORYSJ|nr:hypothetical protein EE612_010319 [Oryza sativa]BAS78045.1 Os02g0269400 [Oryza sativa Japonica Group]
MVVGKVRSMVAAATVMTHGTVFCTVCDVGPSFPPANTTVIPRATACRVPWISLGPPNDSDNTSTPSFMASSTAARTAASPKFPPTPQQTLYTATRARGAPPRATPAPRPPWWWLTFHTRPPAIVEAVCVPWPWKSLGDMYSPFSISSVAPAEYHRAPMIFRLQFVVLNASPVWQTPFHRAGTGPYPSSLKLGDSGHIPVSR